MPTQSGQRYHSRRTLREFAAAWRSSVPYVIDGLLVYVDDVDQHFDRAEGAGATILSEPQDQTYGDRNYRAEDLEGHRWMCAQHIRDVPQGEW